MSYFKKDEFIVCIPCDTLLIISNNSSSIECKLCNKSIQYKDVTEEHKIKTQEEVSKQLSKYVRAISQANSRRQAQLQAAGDARVQAQAQAQAQARAQAQAQAAQTQARAQEQEYQLLCNEQLSHDSPRPPKSPPIKRSIEKKPKINNVSERYYKREISKLDRELKEQKNKNFEIIEELQFFKSLFKTHSNSVVFNLKIKRMRGKPVWVDKIHDDKKYLESLDKDEEVDEWLKPVKCER